MTVGGGYVIESQNSATGVVRREIAKTSKWTHWGVPDYITRVYDNPVVTKITRYSAPIDICWMQYKLNICLAYVKGFRLLDIDGLYGQNTRNAVILYWKQLGWNCSSGWTIGDSTIKALKENRTK
jgi:N-acetylmuramoyl-L-alanine amidase